MKAITIGRYEDNTIAFPDDPKVSGHHCRVYEEYDRYYIEDTHSTNGVYVDEEKIEKPTRIEEQSEVRIVTHTFTGAELIKQLHEASEKAIIEQCRKIEQQYGETEQRFTHNLQVLSQTLHIDTMPYKRVFDSVDDEIKYAIDEYEKAVEEAISILRLLSKSSQKEVITFYEYRNTLNTLCTEAPDKLKNECIDIRMRVLDKMSRLPQQLSHRITEAFKQFTDHYLTTFTAHYETAMAGDAIWQKIESHQVVSTPYILYGIQEIDYPLFEAPCRVNRLQFTPLLKRNNLILRHDSNTSAEAQNIVNNILGRLMASSKSGNVHIDIIDVKDIGGTSNMLKMLDKHVYTISTRPTEINTALNQLDRYVEDVVQNLLYGTYSTLELYNKGKQKQEPYHVVVIKDFPFGLTQEIAHTIQRILINGNKAGVHFIFMYNEEYVRQSEDCHKIMTILNLDSPEALDARTIDLTSASADSGITQRYVRLEDKTLHDIVLWVNAGFELKKDEILRLTDYLPPKDEWWTKHSANRTDIPFGMATNKQIQKLNITQESGQNSAIVIGIPGSGKSVFLHVLIASAMVNYSPRELQMYLLDFSGVEFDVYARHGLPHARVIAPEAEREFGLSILQEVFETGNRRMALCREHGVTNIVELKQKNPDLVVPRLLVIIDEFQKIFEVENDNISREANAKIHAIIQEYRKFGINLVLATQKLPAKSIVPFDLIANRVVFKSDPNDFNNLIRWPHSTPQPRLLTGSCVYNNESGAEMSNYVTRSFFIKASGELEDLVDEVAAFAKSHPEQTANQTVRTFRSNELPKFEERIISEQHAEQQVSPREVGVYVGESIAIAPTHVYVPLSKDSNNNILIIGGDQTVAKQIAYHAFLSEADSHPKGSSTVVMMNFMMEDDPMRSMYETELFTTAKSQCAYNEPKTPEKVKEYLKFIKEKVIDARKADSSLPLTHYYINIMDFQRGRMFDGTGGRGDMQSECSQLLEYILKSGPMVGVFTTLQVDNLTNLGRLGYNAPNLFCHRIALQMPDRDSDKIVGSSAANKLLVLNRPATKYRGLYYNNVTNSITKFKPYHYASNSN